MQNLCNSPRDCCFTLGCGHHVWWKSPIAHSYFRLADAHYRVVFSFGRERVCLAWYGCVWRGCWHVRSEVPLRRDQLNILDGFCFFQIRCLLGISTVGNWSSCIRKHFPMLLPMLLCGAACVLLFVCQDQDVSSPLWLLCCLFELHEPLFLALVLSLWPNPLARSFDRCAFPRPDDHTRMVSRAIVNLPRALLSAAAEISISPVARPAINATDPAPSLDPHPSWAEGWAALDPSSSCPLELDAALPHRPLT